MAPLGLFITLRTCKACTEAFSSRRQIAGQGILGSVDIRDVVFLASMKFPSIHFLSVCQRVSAAVDGLAVLTILNLVLLTRDKSSPAGKPSSSAASTLLTVMNSTHSLRFPAHLTSAMKGACVLRVTTQAAWSDTSVTVPWKVMIRNSPQIADWPDGNLQGSGRDLYPAQVAASGLSWQASVDASPRKTA